MLFSEKVSKFFMESKNQLTVIVFISTKSIVIKTVDLVIFNKNLFFNFNIFSNCSILIFVPENEQSFILVNDDGN